MRMRLNDRLARVTLVLLLSGARAVAEVVPIRNDTIWKDDRGQEIMCQGGRHLVSRPRTEK